MPDFTVKLSLTVFFPLEEPLYRPFYTTYQISF